MICAWCSSENAPVVDVEGGLDADNSGCTHCACADLTCLNTTLCLLTNHDPTPLLVLHLIRLLVSHARRVRRPAQGWQFEYQWFALFFEFAIFIWIDVLIIFPGKPVLCPGTQSRCLQCLCITVSKPVTSVACVLYAAMRRGATTCHTSTLTLDLCMHSFCDTIGLPAYQPTHYTRPLACLSRGS